MAGGVHVFCRPFRRRTQIDLTPPSVRGGVCGADVPQHYQDVRYKIGPSPSERQVWSRYVVLPLTSHGFCKYIMVDNFGGADRSPSVLKLTDTVMAGEYQCNDS